MELVMKKSLYGLDAFFLRLSWPVVMTHLPQNMLMWLMMNLISQNRINPVVPAL